MPDYTESHRKKSMVSEEEAAYAAAAWQRFDGEVSNELLRAVTGAFALIAVADGDLAQSEIDRFVTLVRSNGDMFAGLDLDHIERTFRDIGGAVLSDPAAGRAQALNYVAAVKDHEQHRELVRAAAEIAILADGRKLAREDAPLKDIRETLGLV